MNKNYKKLYCSWCGEEIEEGGTYILDIDNEPQCIACAEQQIWDNAIINKEEEEETN